MSFSCASCSKVFGDQVAVSQHFRSVHNKATYQASIRAARGEKQARKARQMEEAKTQANTNEGVAGLALSPTTYSNPPIDEIVSQQNFYPETPLSFNGSNSKRPGLSPVFNTLGHDFPERQAPTSGTSLDTRITPPEPWYKAQENTPWRDSLQNGQENSPWRRALRDVEEDSPWSRALRVAEENSRWRMFLQNKGSRATQNTPLPTATNRVPTYENDSLPNGPDTPQGDNAWAKPESFCCKDCKSFFQDQETLDSHITSTGHTMHRVPCFVCHKPFPREQSINEHLKTVPHNCIYCNLPVQGHNGVAPHLRFSHQFSCSTCGDCLPDSKAQHLHGAHGVTQVVYWCQTCQPSCGQAFSTQEALEAHIRSLTGTPPPSPSPQTTTWHDRDLSQCDSCIPSCKGHFSTSLETNSVPVIKQLPGPRVLAQRTIPATPEKMLMYPCFTCKPPCGGIFDTQEAKKEHLESMRRIPTYKTARRGKFGFLCTKCEPPCKGFFETQESLLTHHRYIEKKVHLEIEALEVGIRSIKEKSRLEIEAIEIQLRSMREASRLEIEAMNTNLRSMREKLHLDTPSPNETLPSLACDVCKPFCGSTFETEEALERHLDTIIENAMDTRLTSIKKNLLLNTTNPRETVFPLGCHTCTPPCGSTFNTQESQKDHLELVIQRSQLLITRYSKYQFICNTCDPTCGKIFDSQEALETHVSSMIESPRNNLTDGFPNGGCMPYCNFTSGLHGTHGDSETQVTSIIDSSIDQFPCDKCNPSCGRIFDTQNALENHLEFVKGKIRRSATRSNKDKWSSIIIINSESIRKLQFMTHGEDALAEHGYCETPKKFKHQDQIKCINCHGIISKLEDPVCRYHPGKWQKIGDKNRPTCCGRRFKGCIILENHITLNSENSEGLIFQAAPPSSPSNPKRKAVVLGCGLGVSTKNTTEILQLSVVDYFTGETLVDMIVRPKNKIIDYRPRFSGVTEEIMKQAIAGGDFLDSFEGARAELWKWIDNETILIGHSLNHDLWLLQTKHHLIIDTSLSALGSGCKSSSLKTLCQDLLGETIQDGGDEYDCVEDLLAVRELVIWCIGNGGTLEAKAGKGKKVRGEKKRG